MNPSTLSDARLVLAILLKHWHPDPSDEDAGKLYWEAIGRINSDEQPKAEAPKRVVFQKPTLQEMINYGTEIGLDGEECEACYDHYEGNGWRVGKNPMKDWRAAMRNWKRNSNGFNGCVDGAQHLKNGDIVKSVSQAEKLIEYCKKEMEKCCHYGGGVKPDMRERWEQLRARRDYARKVMEGAA